MSVVRRERNVLVEPCFSFSLRPLPASRGTFLGCPMRLLGLISMSGLRGVRLHLTPSSVSSGRTDGRVLQVMSSPSASRLASFLSSLYPFFLAPS